MKEKSPGKSEHADFQIRFLRKLLRGKPNFIDALIPLADLYTKCGLYKNGLELDQRLAKLLPHDETVFYNLACSYALVQDRDNAFRSLGRAIDLGYCDLAHLESDTDLEYLRKDVRYKKILGRIKTLNSPSS